ncbi:MFS transporter [Lentilactobacillus parafarraginis]|uniref:Na+ xyloside symporter related transporter n=3 Tax=Lentilactobacillus parafarraginis TaxID=390842 RepID=A0A0R1Z0R9_9LACO|nr:MFS transporter [Lentilactobacillus parafarraginis]KRM44604.1 Na+ xyloside symporter related transporter [Lentilactobacillus parafarraginis DSM 18390 = JCM 14109]
MASNSVSEKSSFREKVGFWDYLGFGAGDMAINFTFGSLGVFVVYFYTNVVGLSAGVVGTMMLVSRSFDGIIDMVIGGLVDRTRSRWGKTRPWLLFGAIPFALLTVMIFAVPANLGGVGKIAYAFISYNILMISFSSIAIPFGTLNSLVTRDRHQRETFNIFRMTEAQIGLIIVTNLTMPLVQMFGGKQFGWILAYACLGVGSVALLWIVFFTQRERVSATVDENNQVETLKVGQQLSLIFKNKYWMLAFLFAIVFSVTTAFNQSTMVYFAQYVLHDKNLVGIMNVLYYVPTILGFFVSVKLYDRFGKTKMMVIGALISIVGYAMPILMPNSVIYNEIAQAVKGLGQAPLLGALWALFPDTIEYGHWKTGHRIEGLLYSGGSLGQKLGLGIGTATVGWVLGIGHYNGALANQPLSAIHAIYWIFIYLPVIAFVIQLIILHFYKIDEIYPQIMTDLKNHKFADGADK